MIHNGPLPFILMYHSVADGSEDPWTVPIEAFHEQVSWLLGNGFASVPLAFLVTMIKNGEYEGLSGKVVFTFDDGFTDFATNALPILQRYQATATVFVVTHMVGKKADWSRYSKHVPLMSEDELRYAKTQNISLGSHTATHADLTVLDHKELARQLKDSRDRLTDLGESYYSFSYPWGKWSTEVLEAVKASGYQCAVTIAGSMRPSRVNVHLLPRITMRGDMDLRSFQAMFSRTTPARILQSCWRALKRF